MEYHDLSPRNQAIFLAGVRGGDGEEGEPVASGVTEGAAPDPAPDAPPPTDWETRITEWGGEQVITDAMAVHAALQDPDGVASMFVEAGRSLGIPFDRLSGLFDEGGEPDPGTPPPDPEAPVTAAQLAEAVASLQAGITEQTLEGQKAAAKVVIDAEVARLGIDPDEVNDVLERGSKHLADGDFDPAHIRVAIAKGHEDWQKIIQAKAAKYVKTKQEQRDTTPTPVTGGGTPGGSEQPTEAANMDEAKARVRARLIREGALT